MFLKNLVSLMFFGTICSHALSTDFSFEFDLQVFPSPASTQQHFQFRSINLHQITPEDRNQMAACLNDFEGIRSMFGWLAACTLKTIMFFSPYKVLDSVIQHYDEKLLKMPEDERINYHWLIEDLNKQNALVGFVSLSSYVDPCPEEYANNLVEFGLTIFPNYRHRKILSTICVPVLEKMSEMEGIKGKRFCFDTSPENMATHCISRKVDAEMVSNRIKQIDFKMFKMKMPKELFVFDPPLSSSDNIFIKRGD